MSQTTLPVECCKYRDCPGEVVGSSIRGEGKVCAVHNRIEWGYALSRQDQPAWIRRMGALCLEDDGEVAA